MKKYLAKGLYLIIIKTLLILGLTIPSFITGCKKEDPPDQMVKSMSQSVSLLNGVDIIYTASLINVDRAELTIKKDGVLIITEVISEFSPSVIDFSDYYSYSTDSRITKGRYEFILTSDNSSEKLEKRTTIEIPNYKPTLNLLTLDLEQLNFMEVFNATLPIDTLHYNVFADKNPEDTAIIVNSVKSLDGKTIPTLKTTLSGYKVNVKAVTGSLGAYQIELEFGSNEGGLEKSILSGTIGKDTRIVINPLVYTADPSAPYNSMSSRSDKDNYILSQLLLRPKIPYSDKYYTCYNFQMQLFFDSQKLKDKLRVLQSDLGLGKYWLYNNSRETSIDSIYANGGTWDRIGTIEAPILFVDITDISHHDPLHPFRHGINALLTGKDMSTGNLLTNFSNFNMIEPQIPEMNVQIGTFSLPRDCDKVMISYSYVVEDKVNGNYMQGVTLVQFRIDNGVPTLIQENNDPKYNIIKQ
jgi:hypothetical protein